MSSNDYYVGQLVMIQDGGRGTWREERIQKVGRTLVHIGPSENRTVPYRIADQRRNDNYGRQWATYFQTIAQHESATRRERAVDALMQQGVAADRGRLAKIDTGNLEKLWAYIEDLLEQQRAALGE